MIAEGGLFFAVICLGYFLNLANRIQEKIWGNKTNKTIIQFRISRDDQEYGPYTIEELQQYSSEGSLLKSDYVYDGIEWVLLGQFLEDHKKPLTFFKALVLTHSQENPNYLNYGTQSPRKFTVFYLSDTYFNTRMVHNNCSQKLGCIERVR